MFNRKVIKIRAKSVLSTTYWQTFAILLIVMLISSATAGLFSLRLNMTTLNATDAAQIGAFSGILCASYILTIAVSVFLLQPISVGVNKFTLDAARTNTTDLGSLGYCFSSNYKNIVISLFMKELIIFAFMLVPIMLACAALVIVLIASIGLYGSAPAISAAANLGSPSYSIAFGIILIAYITMIPALMKAYSYYLVPYILADDANVSWRDALAKSKQMMRGSRWAAFVMHLSFIGWIFLGSLACGVGVLFVMPYIEAADTQMYLELLAQYNKDNLDNSNENNENI